MIAFRPPALLLSMIAWRSEPVPLSAVFETVKAAISLRSSRKSIRGRCDLRRTGYVRPS